MNQNLSDQRFLECLSINLKEFKEVKTLYLKKQYHYAALLAAEVLFSKPFMHPIKEHELEQTKKYILSKNQIEIKFIKSYLDHIVIPNAPRKPKGVSEEDYRWHYLNCSDGRKSRASGACMALRYYYLTKDKKYLNVFLKTAKKNINDLPTFQEGQNPPAFSWHFRSGKIPGHTAAHIIEELIMALPLFRTLISKTDKLYFLKFFVAASDFHFNSIKKDAMFNLPATMITSVNMVACIFPQFIFSKEWVNASKKLIIDEYCSKRNSTIDGYFREGFAYQRVVQTALLKNYKFWKARQISMPKKFINLVKTAYEFGGKVLRPDGSLPLIGDSIVHPAHEYHMVACNALHGAAVALNNPELKSLAGNTFTNHPCEEILWQMGWGGIQKWQKWKSFDYKTRKIKPVNYSRSGIQFLGCGQGKNSHWGSLYNCPDINHAHQDKCSVEFWAFGRPLISDPGYTGGGDLFNLEYIATNAHSQPVLSRYQPKGPRIENYDELFTSQFETNKHIDYTTVNNLLYENHMIRRSMALVKPSSNIYDCYWIVLDHIERTQAWQGRHLPHEILDTFFHFNAPNSKLCINENDFTCWTTHTGKDFKLKQYLKKDYAFKGKPDFKVSFHKSLKSLNQEDSNANIQITALPKTNQPDYHLGITSTESFTSEFGQKVKRPSVKFIYNGFLPYTMTYIIFPFKGIKKQAPLKALYEYNKNSLNIEIRIGKKTFYNKIKNINTKKPSFILR